MIVRVIDDINVQITSAGPHHHHYILCPNSVRRDVALGFTADLREVQVSQTPWVSGKDGYVKSKTGRKGAINAS